jgi:hypothetical protein
MRRQARSSAETLMPSRSRPAWTSKLRDGVLSKPLAYLATFLTLFASKLLLVHDYTLPHPYWDSWHVEGEWLYKPYVSGNLTFADLFKAASEHRPVVLRLYGLALLGLNGQWDVALQMTVNAALFGLFGCILWRVLAESLDRLSGLLLSVAIIVSLSIPLSWENTLNGHHAGWFFLYIFSTLGMWLAVTRPACDLVWFLCLPLFVAAYLSQFSGVVAPLAASATILFGMLRDRRLDKRATAGVLSLLILVGIGIAIEPRFEAQAFDRAHSAAAFLKTLGYALAWPHWYISWRLVLLHAPWVIAVICLLSRKIKYNASARVVVVLGIWTYVQAAGIAYARGRDGIAPPIRYMDILMIGLITNFAALLLMARWKSTPWRAATAVLAAVWLWSTWSGLEARAAYQYAVMLPAKRKSADIEQSNLRAYAATGQFAYLANKPDDELAYYGGPARVATLLNDPILRTIYPASIRAPLAVAWPESKVFQDQGYAAYTPRMEDRNVLGSYRAAGNWTQGSIESGLISPPQLPYLEFRVTGDLGRPGLMLKLVGQSGSTALVAPSTPTLTSWTAVRVPAPREPFRIVADDESAQYWFAFCQPREMGRLSFYAQWLLEHSSGFLLAGRAGMFLLVLHELCLVLAKWRMRDRKESKNLSKRLTVRPT